MIKGILFDFNGTMFYDSPKHNEAWNDFSLTYRHKPLSQEEMRNFHGMNNKAIIDMLMGDGVVSEEKNKELSLAKEAMYREACRKDPEHFHLMEGLVEVLNQLKESGMPMTICSASIKENIDFFIESFGLDTWFDSNNIVYDDGLHPDKISMFKDGANRIGVDVHECLVIEDSYSGIRFAREAGVKQIIAITTSDKVDEFKALPGVSRVITDFCDFDINQL